MKSRTKQAVKLRGHHLICLHFFRGEGYSPEYVQNLREILSGAEEGMKVEVSSGADDICRVCPNLAGELCSYSKGAEAEIRGMDDTALSLIGAERGGSVFWTDIAGKLPALLPEWSRKYCKECYWRNVCMNVEEFRKLANGTAD